MDPKKVNFMDQSTYDNWLHNDKARRRRSVARIDGNHTRLLVFRSPKTFQLFDDLMDFCPVGIEVIRGLVMGNILTEVMNGTANRTDVEFALLGGEYHDRVAFYDLIEDVRYGIADSLHRDLIAAQPWIIRDSILLLDYRFMFHSASIAMRYSTR